MNSRTRTPAGWLSGRSSGIAARRRRAADPPQLGPGGHHLDPGVPRRAYTTRSGRGDHRRGGNVLALPECSFRGVAGGGPAANSRERRVAVSVLALKTDRQRSGFSVSLLPRFEIGGFPVSLSR